MKTAVNKEMTCAGQWRGSLGLRMNHTLLKTGPSVLLQLLPCVFGPIFNFEVKLQNLT